MEIVCGKATVVASTVREGSSVDSFSIERNDTVQRECLPRCEIH